jgi:hypothetical protein
MSSIDWKRLVDLREQQQSKAMELVAKDTEALDASQGQAQAAQAQWREQLEVKAAHWQSMVQALSGGAVNASQMRDAAAGSRALDAQIAMAGRAVLQAQEQVAQRQAVLDASRGELRAASGELAKARKMQERVHDDQQRRLELQLEDAAEEAAVQRWLGRKPS